MYGRVTHSYNYYNSITMRWEPQMRCPGWYSHYTKGFPHPDGVIIAGSSIIKETMKFAFMDFRNKSTVNLPHLGYYVRNIGMIYDHSTGMVTVAGGEIQNRIGSWKKTNTVIQLPRLVRDSRWNKLPSLTYAVANPMMVNYAEYLYVLGGFGCARCVRMSKNNQNGGWEALDELPKEGGIPLGVEYSGDFYSGALVYDKKIRVLTRTRIMTLNGTRWTQEQYTDTNIQQLMPIVHRGRIIASVQRGHRPNHTISIANYNIGSRSWEYAALTPERCTIGAGRIASFEVGDQ